MLDAEGDVNVQGQRFVGPSQPCQHLATCEPQVHVARFGLDAGTEATQGAFEDGSHRLHLADRNQTDSREPLRRVLKRRRRCVRIDKIARGFNFITPLGKRLEMQFPAVE